VEYEPGDGLTGPVPYTAYKELRAAYYQHQLFGNPSSLAAMEFRVSGKGGISVYGLGRFPVTPYYEQCTRLLARADELRTFIEENKGKLKLKPRAGE